MIVKLAGVAMSLIAATSSVAAQSPAELISLGDTAYNARRPKDALEQYTRAIAADEASYEALWKASRSEIDLAEIAPNRPALDALAAAGRRHAEAAIRVRPSDAEGHFSLARALGRLALSVGARDGIRLSGVIRDEALAALAINSTHPGALHVLGMWNAEILRINGLSRLFARTFLGARVFGLASWDEAQRLMEASVQYDPGRIVHRLDLAGLYADRGDRTRARQWSLLIASAPLVDPNDDLYKRQAAERLSRLPRN